MKFNAAVAFVGLSLMVSAGSVSWDFPRTGCCHEGLPFADGVTGVLVWGAGDTINLTVGRGDLWDHRGGYPWTAAQNYTNIVSLVGKGDVKGLKSLFVNEPPKGWNGRYNPYMLPLGRVTVRLPGATLKAGTLDTSTGLGKLVLADGREIALAFSKTRRLFALKLPKGLSAETKVIPATDFPVYEKTLKGRGIARAEKRPSGFIWRLPADEPVTLDCVARDEKGSQTLLFRTARGEKPLAPIAADVSFDGLAADSVAAWRRFWQEGARVKVPDPVVQEIFDLGMYKFGAMTDPDGIPAGLQGQWLEDDELVPWNGDYHFNINVQECYSPAYRGGHFRHLLPLFRMVLSWRPRLRENARAFVRIDDGYALPHSVDDRGVCIGGFWTGTIDHASSAWIASMMYRYVRYSGDVAFLKEGAYDFMKGAMNVYLAMMEEREGRLTIPLGPSPEWAGDDVRRAVGRDPSFQLAAAHRLAADCIAAAKQLGETVDPRWRDVQKRLPRYTAGKDGFHLFVGQPFVESHRHHSHMAGLYPFDTIDFSDKVQAEAAAASYKTWISRGTGMWTGWCVPWASILHTRFGSAEGAVHMLHAWQTFFNNPGHGSLHDAFRPGFSILAWRKNVMQMDGACAAATAVLELMAHEVNGKVEFFRGCPESWKDVSFENLALSDGRRVSGRRVNGVVTLNKSRAPAESAEERRAWQELLRQIPSTLDGTAQPCYFWAPDAAQSQAVPLIVGLHTWSCDYRQLSHYKTVLNAARRRGWAFVGPNFRGPNSTPAACGGDLAVQDIVDAVNYAKRTVKIDDSRVYIIGGSGGGHMTLLMLGRHPEIFAAGSAFCPITDLARWHADSLLNHPGRGKHYAKMLEKACGGTPDEKPDEYRHRSPLTHLGAARAARVPTSIVTGIHDGWTGSVPVGHAFRAFNTLAEEKDRVSEAEIAAIERDQRIPTSLAGEKVADPFYSEKMRIHFRRTSASVQLTIFEGGHGGNFAAGFEFLSRQRKGQAVDWTLPIQGSGHEEKLTH